MARGFAYPKEYIDYLVTLSGAAQRKIMEAAPAG
jgi:hypothetical protein